MPPPCQDVILTMPAMVRCFDNLDLDLGNKYQLNSVLKINYSNLDFQSFYLRGNKESYVFTKRSIPGVESPINEGFSLNTTTKD